MSSDTNNQDDNGFVFGFAISFDIVILVIPAIGCVICGEAYLECIKTIIYAYGTCIGGLTMIGIIIFGAWCNLFGIYSILKCIVDYTAARNAKSIVDQTNYIANTHDQV